jgi:hypothetical protein
VTVHGLTVALSAKEYELLVKLATQPTRVFTKEELLRDVWGFRSLGSKRRLYTGRGGASRALTLTNARGRASGRQPGEARAIGAGHRPGHLEGAPTVY